ncbi:MAG: hypothetical protein ACKPDM_34880, partial [Dolichospermum sp.]
LRKINMNNHRLEINDLIDSAVNNAVARRNEALASVSDEEAKNVSGGAIIKLRPIYLGFRTIGLIARQ